MHTFLINSLENGSVSGIVVEPYSKCPWQVLSTVQDSRQKVSADCEHSTSCISRYGETSSESSQNNT